MDLPSAAIFSKAASFKEGFVNQGKDKLYTAGSSLFVVSISPTIVEFRSSWGEADARLFQVRKHGSELVLHVPVACTCGAAHSCPFRPVDDTVTIHVQLLE